jgi:hypothetical protein
MLIAALLTVAYHAITINANLLWHWAAVLAGIALLRSAYGLARTRKPSFLIFVLYGFIHVALLIPVRLYALATLRRNHWGSRAESTAVRLPTTRPAGASTSALFTIVVLLGLLAIGLRR